MHRQGMKNSFIGLSPGQSVFPFKVFNKQNKFEKDHFKFQSKLWQESTIKMTTANNVIDGPSQGFNNTEWDYNFSKKMINNHSNILLSAISRVVRANFLVSHDNGIEFQNDIFQLGGHP